MNDSSGNIFVNKPLKNIRVLDLGRVVASGYCGTLLADMGAEVIKIERPGGEFDRNVGPFTKDGHAIVYELILQRNKKSITLNYQSDEGRRLLEELIKSVDILISGFTKKGNDLLGLTYEKLKRLNPGIIFTAISGYGQTGPKANKPCFDCIAQAESGAMSYTGFPDCPPTRAAVPYVDFGTAISAAYGTMVALFQRLTTNEGQMVDVSLMDTAFSFVASMGVIAEYAMFDSIRKRIGNQSFYNFTDSFQTKDGYVVISAIGNKIFERFAKAIDSDVLLHDDKFVDDYIRYQHQSEIHKIVSDWTSNLRTKEVLELLEKARVPCAKICDAKDLIEDDQILSRKMLINLTYPGIGDIPCHGNPVKLSSMTETFEPAKKLGENNKEIFCSFLGLSETELLDLKREGIV